MKHVHFLHISKTGGTALKEALKSHLTSTHYIIHLHPHKYTLPDVPREDKFFFFLRDPISRFKSAFYSRQRKGNPRYNYPWTPGEKIAFEGFSNANELAISLSSKDRQTKQAAVNAMVHISHLRSYYSWFDSKEYFLTRLETVLFIGFQEQLESDFMSLKQILGLPEHIQLPQDDIQAHKNIYPQDSDLSPTAKRNLKMWYMRDYDFLQLCQEKAKQINQL